MPCNHRLLYTHLAISFFCLAAAAVSLLPESMLAVVAVLVLLTLPLAWLLRACLIRVVLLASLCGLLAGVLAGRAYLDAVLPLECQRQQQMLTGRVTSLPKRSWVRDDVWQHRFEFQLLEPLPQPCTGPSNVVLSYYGDKPIISGAHYQLSVLLKRPWGIASPGAFNMQAWFAQRGLHASGSVVAEPVLVRQPSAVWSIDRQRTAIAQSISALPLSPHSAGFLRAVTVADPGGIDTQLWRALQVFGLNHVTVISGLHIGFVAAIGFGLGQLLARTSCLLLAVKPPRWLPGLVAWILALYYTALAGFGTAASRALMMLTVFVVAQMLARNSGAWTQWLLAAGLLMLFNPLAPLSSGVWLSYGAVAGLLWLGQWRGGAMRWSGLLLTQGYLCLIMLVLAGWFFGGASLVSVPANLLVTPVIGFIVIPLSLAAALLLEWLPGLAALLWSAAACILDYLLRFVQAWAVQPPQWMYYRLAPSWLEVLLAVIAVAILVVPGRRWLRLGSLLLLLPLILAPDNNLRGDKLVQFVDVGQGLSVVVRSGDNTLVYDVGGGHPQRETMANTVLLPLLRSQGVYALNEVIISHADLDHSAGMDALITQIPTRRLWHSPQMNSAGGRPCEAGVSWRWPSGVSFQFLSPAIEGELSRNNSSCVLLVDLGDYRLLLPGDIDKQRERDLIAYWGEGVTTDLLSLAHHGSSTSSSAVLLNKTTPQLAVASVGYGNRFGHPSAVVLTRLRTRDIDLLNTAHTGTLTLRISADQPGQISTSLSAARWGWRPYWM